MTTGKKALLSVAVALMLIIVAFVAYIENRRGHYPAVKASTFAHLAPPAATPSGSADITVQISDGALRGTTIRGAIAFRGIPYARPPTGELRWQPPQPPAPWQGVRDAEQPGMACTQRTSGLAPFFDPMAKAFGSTFEQAPIKSSEDCLYLDVWAPEWPVKGKLPVMVWLHGGSNVTGSGTQVTYDGVSLVRHGVLLVTLNYRLGIMGFFSHPELTSESPHHSSGNYGTLDQLAALNWVKQNIANFGGDPENVTLFGESAGAIDSARLMTSPLAAGLFKRVISESGPSFDSGQTLAQAEEFGSSVSALATGDAQATPLQKLRMLPATDVEALAAKAKAGAPSDNTAATVDGWFLPNSPRKAFLTGAIQKVDLLIGLNGRELSAFRLSAAAAAKESGAANPAQSGALEKTLAAAHPYFGNWTKPAMALYFGKMLLNKNAGLDGAANDLIAACPIGAMASLTQSSGAHVFVYRFDRIIPSKVDNDLGAFHSIEVPFVFGALHSQEWQWLPATADDDLLADLIQTYWTNFAKTGDPNASGLPHWPSWNDQDQEFLLVNPDASVSMQRNFQPLFSRLEAAELKRRFSKN